MANQANQSRRSRAPARRLSFKGLVARGFLLIAVLAVLGIAGLMLGRSFTQRGGTVTLSASPDLNPLEAAYLSAYLAANQSALNQPAGGDPTLIEIEVTPGETAAQISDRIASLGLVSDTTLLRNYLRYYGIDTSIKAGRYQLHAAMTIPEIAQALANPESPDISVRIPEGWRREQIAAWLDTQADLPFHGAEFLTATSAPTPEIASAYQIPTGASLEGFIFPDTYRMGKDETADILVSKALENFDKLITPEMRADAQTRGLTLYQVVTLASIVEREAVVDAERPLIASVYLNRLSQGIKLDADPTVQYAMGYQAASDQWWNLNLTQDDYLLVDSPYNTYLYTGLPPGPIANPGLASIDAVIHPADTPYLFFRAKCDGSGMHNFAATYEEHVANGCP